MYLNIHFILLVISAHIQCWKRPQEVDIMVPLLYFLVLPKGSGENAKCTLCTGNSFLYPITAVVNAQQASPEYS